MPNITHLSTAVVQGNFPWTYVRIYADVDGGLYGTGECFFAPGLTSIIKDFQAILIGENFCNIERLVQKMSQAASGAGSLAGIVWNAITGIECALWDLKGKFLELPIWQLLGGKFRDHVELYVDCHGSQSLESLTSLLQPQVASWDCTNHCREVDRSEYVASSVANCAHMVGLGFRGLKYDLDIPGTRFDSSIGYELSGRDIDFLSSLAVALREAAGPDVELAFDAHWRYRASDILQLAKELEPIQPMWLEDPLPPHDLAGMRHLRRHTPVPIATGENLQRREGFLELIVERLCDIATPDFQKAGGLAEARYIASLCQTCNISVAPHMIGSPIALMATAHVSLTIPNLKFCEFHAQDVPFFHDLVEGGTSEWFNVNKVSPTERPGLGIELSDSIGRMHMVDGTTWFDE